ncbi:hypothetical protein [Desulfocurvus sp.]|uniref:hypothetical protein n=1 Tax=Desulfocurvus sp. TaxID=2871698 RepID=UPI0025B9C476|nr:hypothetical protein [Desulfocurvus sp.]MCK9240570.1 hypothetical protein [Desulfocurvus sp.]
MRRMATSLVLAAALALCAGAALAAEVAQGRCIEYDTAAKTITIEEYDTNFGKSHPYGVSTGMVSTYDVKDAKIGLTPEPGDILRIAYEIHGDKRAALTAYYDALGNKRVAIKVMNVTKQSLHGK